MTRPAATGREETRDGSLDAALGVLPMVGILRGCPRRHVVRIVENAAEAGLTVVEVTLDSPEPLAAIEEVALHLPRLVVGAGTVRTPEQVTAASSAGAQFIVAPTVFEPVVAACRTAGLPVLPGAATPSEIERAVALGAHAVKVFPAEQLGGAGFVRAVMAPLGNPRLVPTGGVAAADAAGYMAAGAYAVGMGGSIFGRADLEEGDGAAVKHAVAAAVRALR